MLDPGILENQTVVVENGIVTQIGPTSELKTIPGAKLINAKGKFLMPGLTEMHAHIPTNDDEYVQEVLFLYLSNGVTTIRGMLGDPYHLELKRKVESNEVLSPRIYTSGLSLNGKSVTNAEDAVRMVREQKEAGYDFLKFHPGLKLKVFEALVSTANEVGIGFAGHVSTSVGIQRALEARYASVDHLDGFVEGLVPPEAEVDPNENGLFGYNFTDLADTSRISQLVQRTIDMGVWVVPTQSLLERIFSTATGESMAEQSEMRYISSKTLENWIERKNQMLENPEYSRNRSEKFIEIRRRLIKELFDQGAGIALGSDAPQIFNVPGFSIHHELETYIASGLTIFQALQIATVNPARYFNAEDEFGIIKVGASADMVLLRGNPLDDLGNLKNPEGVMVRGNWLDRSTIENRLELIANKYANK